MLTLAHLSSVSVADLLQLARNTGAKIAENASSASTLSASWRACVLGTPHMGSASDAHTRSKRGYSTLRFGTQCVAKQFIYVTAS